MFKKYRPPVGSRPGTLVVPEDARPTEIQVIRYSRDLHERSVAKEPAERPQSAVELSRRLGEITDCDAWTPERARAWWELHEPSTQQADGMVSAWEATARRPS